MGKSSQRILIVEDSPSLARTYAAQLEQRGYEAAIAETGSAARAMRDAFDCVLLDLGLPDEDGLDILTDWSSDERPVIVITANGSINTAVDAMQCGAVDFLVKPFASERLITTVANALEKTRLTRIVKTYESKIERKTFGGFIGDSLEMQVVYRTLEAAAQSKATVFVIGESGTGKELAARAIHDYGPRANKPFVAINCGAIPSNLLESELFGHVKGAFTGATSDREGAAARAEGGTLFLDEITEMDVSLQPKLLRFLQLGSFQKVGGDKTVQSNIRIIAATNRNPQECVKENLLREDLYYRLNVLPVEIPPLREHSSDILPIASELLRKFAEEEDKKILGFDEAAKTALAEHPWPGNVRELQNIIRQIVVMSDKPVVQSPLVENLLSSNTALKSADTGDGAWKTATARCETPKPLWQVELEVIDQAIAYCNGNIQKASRLLDISPSTIYRKRERAQSRQENVA